jgi:hypothetical protein
VPDRIGDVVGVEQQQARESIIRESELQRLMAEEREREAYYGRQMGRTEFLSSQRMFELQQALNEATSQDEIDRIRALMAEEAVRWRSGEQSDISQFLLGQQQQESQFGRTLSFQQEQFAKDYNLRERQFLQAVVQFGVDEAFRRDEMQWGKDQFNMTMREQARQYNLNQENARAKLQIDAIIETMRLDSAYEVEMARISLGYYGYDTEAVSAELTAKYGAAASFFRGIIDIGTAAWPSDKKDEKKEEPEVIRTVQAPSSVGINYGGQEYDVGTGKPYTPTYYTSPYYYQTPTAQPTTYTPGYQQQGVPSAYTIPEGGTIPESRMYPRGPKPLPGSTTRNYGNSSYAGYY